MGGFRGIPTGTVGGGIYGGSGGPRAYKAQETIAERVARIRATSKEKPQPKAAKEKKQQLV